MTTKLLSCIEFNLLGAIFSRAMHRITYCSLECSLSSGNTALCSREQLEQMQHIVERMHDNSTRTAMRTPDEISVIGMCFLGVHTLNLVY